MCQIGKKRTVIQGLCSAGSTCDVYYIPDEHCRHSDQHSDNYSPTRVFLYAANNIEYQIANSNHQFEQCRYRLP
mgnify:CR=1 FL=1